jgi:transposase
MTPGGVALKRLKWIRWTGAQHAFAVKLFYKNNDGHVVSQREFRKKFGFHRNSKVPSAHAIKTWVNNFEETGSTV